MAEYQECDFSGRTEYSQLPSVPERQHVFRNCEPGKIYSPCSFCSFYASEMCNGCGYFSTCVGGITGDAIGGNLTKKEAMAYADDIYDEWERGNYRKDYPRTWWSRLKWHRLRQCIARLRYKVKAKIRKITGRGNSYTVRVIQSPKSLRELFPEQEPSKKED